MVVHRRRPPLLLVVGHPLSSGGVAVVGRADETEGLAVVAEVCVFVVVCMCVLTSSRRGTQHWTSVGWRWGGKWRRGEVVWWGRTRLEVVELEWRVARVDEEGVEGVLGIEWRVGEGWNSLPPSSTSIRCSPGPLREKMNGHACTQQTRKEQGRGVTIQCFGMVLLLVATLGEFFKILTQFCISLSLF